MLSQPMKVSRTFEDVSEKSGVLDDLNAGSDSSHSCQGVVRVLRLWRRRDLNPRPLECDSSALPLSYAPTFRRQKL
jgi:hypothetical protein